MGHKEQLLEGAKQCLREKGYARTTARDIVAASGTNLASIGYHYGSKEALLTAAMMSEMGAWTDRVAPPPNVDPNADPRETFETVWTGLIDSFGDVHPLLLASFEAFSQANRVPELREQLAEGHEQARRGLVAIVLGVDEEDVTEEQTRTLGSFLLALIPGVMVQYLIDPDRSPSGRELAEGLRALTGGS